LAATRSPTPLFRRFFGRSFRTVGRSATRFGAFDASRRRLFACQISR
jgi:hypothetical protein